MRAILTLVTVLAVAWCGYWFIGARVVTQGVDAAMAEARARGWRADAADVSVLGFPNRFDLTVTSPDLGDPARGFGWTAPFVQVFAMTWRPWHVIAAFAPEQQITTPAGVFVLTAGKLQASLRARPDTSLPLEQFTLVGKDLTLLAPRDRRLATPDLRFATRDLDGTGLRQEVGLEITALDLGSDLVPARLDLPQVVDRIHLQADLDLDAPLDRQALRRRPALKGIDLHEALVVWQDVTLAAEGRLVPDAAGLAEGSLTLRVTNWRRVLAVVGDAGLIDPASLPTVSRMLGLLALQSGDPAVLSATLTFSGGLAHFGPMSLGSAPRLR